jgi:hypothetical protein
MAMDKNWQKGHFAKLGSEIGNADQRGSVAMSQLLADEAKRRARRRKSLRDALLIVLGLGIIGGSLGGGWLWWQSAEEERLAVEERSQATARAEQRQQLDRMLKPVVDPADLTPTKASNRPPAAALAIEEDQRPAGKPIEAAAEAPVAASPAVAGQAVDPREKDRLETSIKRMKDGVRIQTQEKATKVAVIADKLVRYDGAPTIQEPGRNEIELAVIALRRSGKYPTNLKKALVDLNQALAAPVSRRPDGSNRVQTANDGNREAIRITAGNVVREMDSITATLKHDWDVYGSQLERLAKTQGELDEAKKQLQELGR